MLSIDSFNSILRNHNSVGYFILQVIVYFTICLRFQSALRKYVNLIKDNTSVNPSASTVYNQEYTEPFYQYIALQTE